MPSTLAPAEDGTSRVMSSALKPVKRAAVECDQRRRDGVSYGVVVLSVKVSVFA